MSLNITVKTQGIIVAVQEDFGHHKHFVENTQVLQITETSEDDFLYHLKWIFKALVMILSDISDLPELLKELTE